MAERLQYPDFKNKFVTIASKDWLSDQKEIFYQELEKPQLAALADDPNYVRSTRLNFEALRTARHGYRPRAVELGLMKSVITMIQDATEELKTTGTVSEQKFFAKMIGELLVHCRNNRNAYIHWLN